MTSSTFSASGLSRDLVLSSEVAVVETQTVDRARVEEALAGERHRLAQETPESNAWHTRASRSLAGGVASELHGLDPYPIYISTALGCRLVDLDGREYWDFHAAFGAAMTGHAHPAVMDAITAGEGMCFGTPSPHAALVAETLSARFGLPIWRFHSSGTEATMSGLRLARAYTGKRGLLRIDGSYHGHSDAMLAAPAAHGLASEPGIPIQLSADVYSVRFNDSAGLRAALTADGTDVACVMLELPFTKGTVIQPNADFLGLLCEIAADDRIVFILDEVLTGFTAGPGGASGYFGVVPDLIVVGKSLAGGLPCAALGGREPIMALVSDGRVPFRGTFNGSPVTMAAAQAALSLLNEQTFAAIDGLARAIEETLAGDPAVTSSFGYPTRVVALGSVPMADGAMRDWNDWDARRDRELIELFWLYQLNRGVYLSPRPQARWIVTAAHTHEACAQLTDNARALAAVLVL